MSNSNYMLPFCVYHKYDRSSNSLYGYLGNSQKDKNGKFKCIPYDNDWELKGTFYAIDPKIRPIPHRMNLYMVERNEGFPYNSTKLDIDYDFYFTQMQKNKVYFLTYSSIIKFTVPLYFFKNGMNLLPSFTKPDASDKFWDEWTELKPSPLYVITDKSIINKSIDNLEFKCVNGACIPWPEEIDDIYIANKNDSKFDFTSCLMYCNVINSNRGVNSTNLLSNIRHSEENSPLIKTSSISNTKPSHSLLYILVIIIVVLVIIGIAIICFFLSRKGSSKKIFTNEMIKYM
jgi:hypothetical protein|uniref:Uncharacterized protein n=1 Tax=viral metagenome TaxID=1070528 RepID=A0A6C0J4I8_9ZZZZ